MWTVAGELKDVVELVRDWLTALTAMPTSGDGSPTVDIVVTAASDDMYIVSFGKMYMIDLKGRGK